MDPRLILKMAPERRLIMTFALRQALEILQMPQQELGQWLLSEIEKNPLLELKSTSAGKRFEIDVASPPNLYEHLLSQIRENFSDPKDQLLATIILEHLDERGFIATPLETITQKPYEKVLSTLQTFDPPGIFARNLKEALLLQLRAKGKSDTLTYTLVETCFDDLLHGRYTLIKKKLNSQDLAQAIADLARLSLRPAQVFHHEPITPIYPDIQICKIDTGWTVQLIEDELPKFHIQNEYLQLEPETKEEKESLRDFKIAAKWICRSLTRRRKLLHEIARILVCKQSAYLEQKGPLTPLTIKELSEALEIHESTLSRALSGKFANTPRGIIPLRSLITATPEAQNARDILETLIRNEDKNKPFSDDELAQALKAKGHPIARRTISKYRSQLKIGPASQRKHRGQ